MSWVPLHVHSQYSILDSSASVDAIAEKAAEFKMPAVALTDQGNMYGAVEFFKACKGAGVRPIIGCELYVAPQARTDKKRIPGLPHGFPIVLLAKNKAGYQNLCVLSSLAHLEGFYWTPRIDKELLEKHAEGLVCLSGPHNSSLAHFVAQGDEEGLRGEIEWYRSVFKENYYFEILRHRMKEEDVRRDGMDQEGWLYQQYLDAIKRQESVNAKLIELSKELGVRCVAANDTRYVDRDDWNAHEIMMNIQSGEPCEIWEKDSYGNLKQRVKNPKRQVSYTHEMYFKSAEEMQELFADIPDALSATVEIAAECKFEFDFKTRYYPVFVPPHLEGKTFTVEERNAEAEKYLRQLCEEGIGVRYTPERLAKVAEKYPGRDPMEVVRDRLKYELDVILPKGMGDYLLIVWDFINWAKKSGIPMGPGRGSGAGSIVLYLIGITDIEPLRFNLFFERFINPERISYPDIDVDICMDRRAEVIDYTVKKYGKDKVAQIITFGTMKAKMAIKDVGRVLSIPLMRVNEIAKLVPEDPNMTLDKALEIDPELKKLYGEDEEVRRLIDIARKLEGSVRNTGIHAAGMIISGDPIIERCPVCTAKDSEMAVTQYSMKPVESVGMLKIDFLGLKTLTSIQHAVNAIRKRRGKAIDWINLPLDDKPTFDLLNHGKTMGIFQLESGGMQDLAKQLHIDKFEEIIAVGALYRPGPMEMIPSFINRKHKREVIEIDHPLMNDILLETYGIMVYQEQVMAIASRLAGYTLGEGDVLRRAMGKKDKEEMARQREKFRTGALKNGIDEQTSMHIFDKVEKFASYGFNKSHAAAYGYISYATAYLKANYPSEWLAALMTTDSDDLSKVTKHIHEALTLGIAILPPDVNESAQEFVALPKGIRFAMGGIKGVGEGVVEAILEEREKKGPYKSLYDFVERIDTRKVGKKVIENLIEAGCFDFTGWEREAMLISVDPMYEEASNDQKEAAKGVMNLFSLLENEKGARFATPPVVKDKMPRQKVLKREHELLGIYLNGHPLDDFRHQLQRLSCVPLGDFEMLPSGSVCRIAFIIEGVVVKISQKSQRKFAILTIGDGLERFELPIWPDLYEEKGALMVENQLLYAVVQKESQEGQVRLQCRWLDDLTRADEAMIQVCDNAFDQAKQQAKMSEMRERSRAEKAARNPAPKEAEVKKKSFQKLKIHLDADLARMSHILALKDAFRSHSGEIAIEIAFVNQLGKISSLHIDKTWGVDYRKELETKLTALSSVKALAWE
ncbi:MAG: DNA polymerase III subunit alpha [Verrucomicrobia bacterium]|nr:DNA polymerase III subunit alpha [Verrucomicrobiota bacterium]